MIRFRWRVTARDLPEYAWVRLPIPGTGHSLEQVPLGRWGSWTALVVLIALTCVSATLSLWSAPRLGPSGPTSTRKQTSSSGSQTTTTTLNLTPVGWLPRGCTPLEGTCAPAGAQFTLSATNLAVGQSVTLTGNDCPPGTLVITSLGPENHVGDTHVAGADGTWSVTTTISPGTYGPYTVTAGCVNVFDYPNSFAITVSTPYHLEVLPSTTVAPGTTITVEPVGTFCTSLDSASVGISSVPDATFDPVDSNSTWPVPLQVFPMDMTSSSQVVSSSWHATLTLPTTMQPGIYYVVAGCSYSRSYPGLFAPTAITVRRQ